MSDLLPDFYQTPAPVSAACVAGAHDECDDRTPACACDCHEDAVADAA